MMNLLIYPADEAPEAPIEIMNVDRVSLIDNQSHGAGSTFGINNSLTGRLVWISSPNVAAVVVDVV
jgi:hypothetical protein